MKKYSKVNEIPQSSMVGGLVDGCLVLEGGAWRGIYSQGVTDVFMENGINLQTTIGVSAGAMTGISYVSGQVGRSARFNLSNRQDPAYCGYKAFQSDHGITGFTFFFDEVEKMEPINHEIFDDPNRRFVVVATDVELGKPVYFEKGQCDLQKAIQASATVPYVSKPVMIDGVKYLDGGISDKIPYRWAMNEGYQKIVVIKTRDANYRKKAKRPNRLIDILYHNYKEFMTLLRTETPVYNLMLDELDQLHAKKEVFVISPSEPLEVLRFERDVEKLGYLYELGRKDGMHALNDVKAYLGIDKD